MAIIYELKKAKKSYGFDVNALDNVDLKIEAGEVVVILGPSGSGKSTLLNILSGLDTLTNGEAFYRSESLSKMSENELLKYRYNSLGFVFQSYNLLPSLTGRENIELGKTHQNDADLNNVIKKVGLEEHQHKYPYQLSGGQMQRVAIARSLIKKPDAIFCDEPTGALDEEIGKIILNELQKINKEEKTTIIIVTHNPAIAKMGNTVIYMNSGKIVKTEKKKIKYRLMNWGGHNEIIIHKLPKGIN